MNTPAGQSPVTPTEPREVAISRLMDLYGDALYGLGRRLCKNDADAEDLIQETFLLAFRKWHQFQGRSDPKTWLYTIATRLSKRMYRTRSGQPARITSLDDRLGDGTLLKDQVPARQPSALAEQIRRERRQRIERAVISLPIKLRVPFVLKDVLELTVVQIAKVLGIKQATASTRVRRARLRLRQVLTPKRPRKLAPLAYERQVCLDLARARQEASDRGIQFPLSKETVCQRCMSFFSTFDRIHDHCMGIAQGELPPQLSRRTPVP